MELATELFRICWNRWLPVRGLCLTFVVLLTGCSSAPFPVHTETLPYNEEQLLARQMARDARYRLRVGDRFKVAFKYETDLDQDNLVVLPDGYISLGGAGNLRAAGLTIEQLSDSLVEEFGHDYRNPDLTVVVQEIAEPEVYVMGEVENPGLYKMAAGGAGVLQSISMAGGFTKEARKSETVLLRAGDDGFMVRSFDLSNVQHLGLMDMTYLDIQAYDIVYVPRSSLGDFSYLSQAIFGSALHVTRFFWDIYALANIEKIDRIVR